MYNTIRKIRNSFSNKESRSFILKTNIIGSLFLKAVSILIGLAFVPLILNYLDPERYGLWLTITSIVGWFTFFDLGLGNGLRNKLAESIAVNKTELAREYISTTYFYISISFTFLSIIFFIVNQYLDWTKILNISSIKNSELQLITSIVFLFFFIRFILNIIVFILKGLQKTALSDTFGPLGNVFSLVIIFILTKTTDGSLVNLAIVLSIVPVLVLFAGTLIFFHKNQNYKPSLKFVNRNHRKSLFNLGIKFFFIQLTALILFSSSNIIITQIFSPEKVTVYNIAYKYFTIPVLVFQILLNPLWSAFTDAYYKNDVEWCKRILKKFNLLSIAFSIGIVIMLILSQKVFYLWVGEKVLIQWDLSLALSIFAVFTLFIAPYTNFISGVGKLKLGLYVITFKLILYIPVAILLSKYFGVAGVVLATVIINFPSILFEPLQTYKIINRTATGIWNE